MHNIIGRIKNRSYKVLIMKREALKNSLIRQTFAEYLKFFRK